MSWDILRELISNHGSELISALTESGFSRDQAENFLPEAGQGIVDAFGDSSDLVELLGSDTSTVVASILEKIDTESVASKAGLDESMVNSGFSALIPKVLAIFKSEGGVLASLIGGEGGRGLLGGLNSLMSKFLK